MFHRLGHLISWAPRRFLGLAVLLTLLAGSYGATVMQHLSVVPGWDVPDSPSAQVRQAIREQRGYDETTLIVLFRPRPGQTLTVDAASYQQAVETVLDRIQTSAGVMSIDSYYLHRNTRMRSGDQTYALVRLVRGNDEGIHAFEALRGHLTSEVLDIRLGGELATYMEVRDQLTHDIRYAEWVSFAVLAVLLIWVFRSGVAALLPLVIGGVSVVLSMALLKVCTLFTDITVYAANVVSMLGLGLAIDYALFIVSRYREELAQGQTTVLALSRTLATAGHTVAFSGVTVAASLLCLLLLPQPFFRSMGLAGSISVVAAMLTSILLLPTLLTLLGPRINWLTLPGRTGVSSPYRWVRFSHAVMRNARGVLLVSLAILAVLGTPILHMQVGPADSKSLPLRAESRQVQETLEWDFPFSQMTPIVLSVNTTGPASEPAGLDALAALTEQIRALPGVTKVEGLVSLDTSLTLADYRLLYQYPEQFAMAGAALEQFATGSRSLMLVRYEHASTTPEARELVQQIRALPRPAGITAFQVGGFPAEHLDYVDSLQRHVPWVMLAIVLIIGVLLFLMLGSVLLPLKAVLTNLLSLSATFGGLVWVFQDGHLADWLGFTAQTQLDGTVLVLIFATAFGLSIDYEVFLLSRIRENVARGQAHVDAVAAGIQRSGPIITSAAVLIGVVLGTFATGEVVFMKAMGLGLLFSVIVDATLVRMLLVPATLKILGAWTWWAPRWLQRLYHRFNLAE